MKNVIQAEVEDLLSSAKISLTEARDIKPDSVFLNIDNERINGYNYLCKALFNKYSNDIIYDRLLMHSQGLLESFYCSVKNMITKAEKQHKCSTNYKGTLQKEINNYIDIRNGYLIKGDLGFEIAKANREKFLYQFIIYELKCKILEYYNLPYIGFTSDINERLATHIFHSLEPLNLIDRTYKNIVPFQKAIRKAIEMDLRTISNKIYEIELINSRTTTDSPIQTLDELYFWLDCKKSNWEYYILINHIINRVIAYYFSLDILELHKSKHTVRNREKHYTLNYKHRIGYRKTQKQVKGTIWPNGLNSVVGGRGGESYTDIPIFDIVAMFTLGFTEIEKITDILRQEYKNLKNVSSTTIGRRIIEVFGSREHALDLFLKPIVLNFILDECNFELQDITNILGFSRLGMTLYLKRWFNGETFSQIRDRNRRSLFTLQELEMKYKISIVQWVTWALFGTNQEIISKKIGVSIKTIYELYQKISFILFGSKNCSYEQFKKIIRRKIAIRLLKLGVEPKQIVEEAFKMDGRSTTRNLKACFNNMEYIEILKNYYKN